MRRLPWLIITLLLVSCSNLFTPLSQRDTNKAKLFEAKILLDRSDWSGALATIESMETNYQLRREVQALKASAFAGRCGIDMLTLVEGVTVTTSSRLFVTLFGVMQSATTTSIDDCAEAEATLSSIGEAIDRTVDENLLMAFVQFGKIGAILNYRADMNDDNVFDAGDAAFDECATVPASGAGGLPDADTATDLASANQLVASLSILIQSLQATGSEIAQTDLADIEALCDEAVNNIGPSYDFCNTTDPAAVTADQRSAIRALISENTSIGLGSCVGDLATCVCPN